MKEFSGEQVDLGAARASRSVQVGGSFEVLVAWGRQKFKALAPFSAIAKDHDPVKKLNGPRATALFEVTKNNRILLSDYKSHGSS